MAMLPSDNSDRHFYTEEQREKLRQKGARYFMFREDFLDIVSMEGAVVLQKLINFSTWKMKKADLINEDYNGWFPYTVKLFATHLRIPAKKTQRRLLKELIDKHFIVINREAKRNRQRIIWIDIDKIEKSLNEVIKHKNEARKAKKERRSHQKGGFQKEPSLEDSKKDRPKRVPNKDQKTIEGLKKEQGRSTNGGVIKPFGFFNEGDTNLRSPGRRLADLLYIKLQSRRKIMNEKDLSLIKWGEAFDKLIKTISARDQISGKKSYQYLRGLLIDHGDHVGESYWPRAYCADTVSERILAIEDARIRLQHAQEKQREKTKSSIHDRIYALALRAAKDDGNYRITYHGRLCYKRGDGSWTWAEEGTEMAYDAPENVLWFIRYIRGKISPTEAEIAKEESISEDR